MRYLLSIIFFAVAACAGAQKLPPFQPEQDACGALKLCNGYFFTPFSYDAEGRTPYEIYGINGWFPGLENNSVWLKVRVAVAGRIVFAISPVNEKDDYDFSLFDITGLQCPYNIQALTDTRIRYNMNCNGNCPGNDGGLSHPGGKTGLNYPATDSVTEAGVFGHAFNKYIDAEAGDEYLVMVDNYTSSASGFAIDFAGTTAIFENDGPQYDSVVAECGTSFSSLKLVLDQPVLCGSIAADGSDFWLGNGVPAVIAASSTLCGSSQAGAYTRELLLKLDGRLQPGAQYTLYSKKGTDGNTLLGVCGAAQADGHTIGFKVAFPLTISAGNDTAVCAGGAINLNAQTLGVGTARIRWQPTTYLSNNAIANPVSSPPQDMEYVVLVAPVGYPAVCQYRDTIRIKVLKGFDIIAPDTTLCRPSTLRIRLAGDTGLAYTWSPPDGLDGTTGMVQTAVITKPVTYTVKASYPGCKDSLQSINIGLRDWPGLVTGDTIVCQGQPVPMQVAGDGDFIHKWSPRLYLSDPSLTNPVARPDSSIGYTLTVSYPGCADSVQSVAVAVEPMPHIAPLQSKTLCLGSSMQMRASVSPPGYSNYLYQWEPAAAFDNALDVSPIYTATGTGNVSVRVSTPLGCAGTSSQLFTVSPLPVVNAGKDMTIIEGQVINLQGSVNQPAATIKWAPAQYLSSDVVLNPVATLPASQNFVFSVLNEYGCAARDSVVVTVLKSIHIPNAFSPNGDGINDVWNIPGLAAYPSADVQVFNRWGQKVFESKGYGKPWDGTVNGKDLALGVYYYLIDLQGRLVAGDGNGKFTGSVTVLR